MKVNVLKRSRNELEIEVVGEGHTFCNALQNILLKDKSVEYAGYRIPHPLVAQPIIYVRTKHDKRPEDLLIEAAQNLGREAEEVRKAFEEAIMERADDHS